MTETEAMKSEPIKPSGDFSHWKQKTALFLSGQTVSLFGSSLVQFAIIWYITLSTQSGAMMTIASVCGFAPQVAISLFSGVWADRYNRKLLIIGADAMVASATFVLALFFLSGHDDLWMVFLVSAIRSVGSGIQTPAVNAVLPQIVPPEKLIRIGGINGSLQSVMFILSPAAAGMLLSIASLESTFFIDVAMGILTMLFNRQIMTYFGADALAVYGVIVNVGTIVQCCAYSVGQASQPIISMNFGAKQWARIRETLKYALRTVCFFSIVWTAATLLFPDGFIRIFMSPTNEVLAIAPAIMRSYCISFLLLPFNIFSTYYFQALMKPGTSLFVSVARGLVISGLLIYLLPVLAGADSLWFAMPITELVIAIVVVWLMVKYTKELEKNSLYSSKA